MGNAASRRPRKDAPIPDAIKPSEASTDQSSTETGLNIDLNRTYKFNNVDGEFTVAELVEMEFAHDERYKRVSLKCLLLDILSPFVYHIIFNFI